MAQTHFGFQTVDEQDKARRVRGVFDSVARRYDVMNDVMSFGLHRAWKAYTAAVARLRAGDRVLDIAGGTGDLSRAFARKVGPTGVVLHTDINFQMLSTGRDRLQDEGLVLPTTVCDAEALPLRKPYDFYSLNILPLMGKLVARDADSYRYLAESIRMHPPQAELKAMMKQAGFGHVDVHNLSAGIVALHVGIKC